MLWPSSRGKELLWPKLQPPRAGAGLPSPSEAGQKQQRCASSSAFSCLSWSHLGVKEKL